MFLRNQNQFSRLVSTDITRKFTDSWMYRINAHMIQNVNLPLSSETPTINRVQGTKRATTLLASESSTLQFNTAVHKTGSSSLPDFLTYTWE